MNSTTLFNILFGIVVLRLDHCPTFLRIDDSEGLLCGRPSRPITRPIYISIFFSHKSRVSFVTSAFPQNYTHSLTAEPLQQYSWTLHGRLTQMRFHATLTLTRTPVFLQTKSIFTQNVTVPMVRVCWPRITPLAVLTMASTERAPGGARNTHMGANPRAIQGPPRPYPSCVCRHIVCLGLARERGRRFAFRCLRGACGNSSHPRCKCRSRRYSGEQC